MFLPFNSDFKSGSGALLAFSALGGRLSAGWQHVAACQGLRKGYASAERPVRLSGVLLSKGEGAPEKVAFTLLCSLCHSAHVIGN